MVCTWKLKSRVTYVTNVSESFYHETENSKKTSSSTGLNERTLVLQIETGCGGPTFVWELAACNILISMNGHRHLDFAPVNHLSTLCTLLVVNILLHCYLSIFHLSFLNFIYSILTTTWLPLLLYYPQETKLNWIYWWIFKKARKLISVAYIFFLLSSFEFSSWALSLIH